MVWPEEWRAARVGSAARAGSHAQRRHDAKNKELP